MATATKSKTRLAGTNKNGAVIHIGQTIFDAHGSPATVVAITGQTVTMKSGDGDTFVVGLDKVKHIAAGHYAAAVDQNMVDSLRSSGIDPDAPLDDDNSDE